MTTDFINTQTIGAVIVALAAFKAIELIINRLTSNGNFGINKKIDELRDNHFHELREMLKNHNEILNRIDRRGEDMNGKLIQVVELLKLLKRK